MCLASHLNNCLKKFYAGLRMTKGENYQTSSYLAARSIILRHLPALGRPFNLCTDETFNSSNQLLDVVLNKANRTTKPVQHKDSMS